MTKIEKLSDLKTQFHNANKHTPYGLRLLEKSVQQDGFLDAQTAAADGEIISGSARLELAAEKFADVEPIIVHSDGTRPVVVIRDDIPNAETARARRLSVAANKIAQVDFNPDFALLQEWAGEDEQIKKLFSDDEWREGTGENISGMEKGKKLNPRKLPLDFIFTISSSPRCCIACDYGFLYGIQSSKSVAFGDAVCRYEDKQRHKLSFIDNDFYKYDHEIHLASVKRWKPKYCTVRDIMTEEQCKAAGIAYYSFDQIMTWAEELAQYCSNVIVIPKYDCIKDIPAKFMLGYSVPTSHGGTPLSVDLFRGRRVHLLGGSWAAQLDYLAELGEDVVSVDNNYENYKSEFGDYFDKAERKYKSLSDVVGYIAKTGFYAALCLSFTAINQMINELHGGNGQPAEENK